MQDEVYVIIVVLTSYTCTETRLFGPFAVGQAQPWVDRYRERHNVVMAMIQLPTPPN